MTTAQDAINAQYAALKKQIVGALTGGTRLAVVQAPPGSGKTHMLLEVVADLVRAGKAVALAAQTNRQADDIARRWAARYPKLAGSRFGSSTSVAPADFPASIPWLTSSTELTDSAGMTVGTTARWTMSKSLPIYDILAVDEAWQMPWADLMQCATISDHFLLIGDPGQIAPVVTIDVRRWDTSPRAPHRAAPEVVLSDASLREQALVTSLPSCRRLPAQAVPYVLPFYDFDFSAFADPDDRALSFVPRNSSDLDLALQALSTLEPLALTVATPVDGPPLDVDGEIAELIAAATRALVEASTLVRLSPSGQEVRLRAEDVGICATHRVMLGEIRKALGPDLQAVQVDTPERWQGLERPVMLVVHPLSGTTSPSDFDLDTGRLCVMASRQQAACIVVTRDHLGHTLRDAIPSATQGPGLPDRVGRGLEAHRRFWTQLEDAGRVRSVSTS